jgi:hypothetical protein
MVTLSSVTTKLNAQIYLIPQVGMNLSKFTFNVEGYENTVNVGFQVGLLGRFGKKAFLQTGVLYSDYSNQMFMTDSIGSANDNLDVQNILLPINVGFNILNTDLFKFRLIAGINLSFPIKIEPNDFNIDKSNFSTSSVGAAIGFGFDIYRFVLDANFSFGMNDMINVNNNKAGLNLYMLNVGYLIGGYN